MFPEALTDGNDIEKVTYDFVQKILEERYLEDRKIGSLTASLLRKCQIADTVFC
jgi:hypothetical protein